MVSLSTLTVVPNIPMSVPHKPVGGMSPLPGHLSFQPPQDLGDLVCVVHPLGLPGALMLNMEEIHEHSFKPLLWLGWRDRGEAKPYCTQID